MDASQAQAGFRLAAEDREAHKPEPDQPEQHGPVGRARQWQVDGKVDRVERDQKDHHHEPGQGPREHAPGVRPFIQLSGWIVKGVERAECLSGGAGTGGSNPAQPSGI